MKFLLLSGISGPGLGDCPPECPPDGPGYCSEKCYSNCNAYCRPYDPGPCNGNGCSPKWLPRPGLDPG